MTPHPLLPTAYHHCLQHTTNHKREYYVPSTFLFPLCLHFLQLIIRFLPIPLNISFYRLFASFFPRSLKPFKKNFFYIYSFFFFFYFSILLSIYFELHILSPSYLNCNTPSPFSLFFLINVFFGLFCFTFGSAFLSITSISFFFSLFFPVITFLVGIPKN